MATQRFKENRLTKALQRHSANMRLLIGNAKTDAEIKELAISLSQLAFFNKEFNQLYSDLDSKMITVLNNIKGKKYYCKELNITLQLDEDNIIEIIEN